MASNEFVIDIENGEASFIYDDQLSELIDGMGKAEVTRASHVEPVFRDGHRGWTADMTPSGGPVLGADAPYATREEALQAERDWLREFKGL